MQHILLIAMFLFCSQIAAIDVLEFKSAEQQQQFKELTSELRCPVCQNQNLADSGAGLADDLREEIYQQVLAGNKNNEIIDFMVQRYGDFIIYRPRLKPTNYLLWFGPALFLLIGLFILYKQTRKHTTPDVELDDMQQQELKSILNQIDENKP